MSIRCASYGKAEPTLSSLWRLRSPVWVGRMSGLPEQNLAPRQLPLSEDTLFPAFEGNEHHLGFLARAFIVATLPHSQPTANEFTRIKRILPSYTTCPHRHWATLRSLPSPRLGLDDNESRQDEVSLPRTRPLLQQIRPAPWHPPRQGHVARSTDSANRSIACSALPFLATGILPGLPIQARSRAAPATASAINTNSGGIKLNPKGVPPALPGWQ